MWSVYGFDHRVIKLFNKDYVFIILMKDEINSCNTNPPVTPTDSAKSARDSAEDKV